MITASDAFHIDDPAALLRREGELRERLAAYFLTMPPLDEQNSSQRRQTRRALNACWDLDMAALLVYRAAGRPLWQAIWAVFWRHSPRGQGHFEGGRIGALHPSAPPFSQCVSAPYGAAHPHFLAAGRLSFRGRYDPRFGRSGPSHPAPAVHVRPAGGLSACGTAGKRNRRAARRRLSAPLRHGGTTPSVSGFCIGSGISRESGVSAAGFASPSAEELLANPLSPLYTGLYSVLEE